MTLTKAWNQLENTLGARLKPIRNEAEYDQMLQVMQTLTDAGAHQQGHELQGLLTLVGDLMMEWEARQNYVPELLPNEMLDVLMEEQGLTQQALAEATGISQGIVSRLLHGEREMRLEHIRRFAEFFKVSPAIFV